MTRIIGTGFQQIDTCSIFTLSGADLVSQIFSFFSWVGNCHFKQAIQLKVHFEQFSQLKVHLKQEIQLKISTPFVPGTKPSHFLVSQVRASHRQANTVTGGYILEMSNAQACRAAIGHGHILLLSKNVLDMQSWKNVERRVTQPLY